MGLFDKAKQAKQSAADAMAQAGAMQQQAGRGGFGAPTCPAWAARTWPRWPRTRPRSTSWRSPALEAPGVIHTITATGTPDVSGATMHAIAVTYRPEGGDPIETTIEQSLLPFQLEGLAEGKPCTVKYDPDMPTSADPAELVGARHMGVFKDGFKARSRAPRSSATTTAACRRCRAPSRTSQALTDDQGQGEILKHGTPTKARGAGLPDAGRQVLDGHPARRVPARGR